MLLLQMMSLPKYLVKEQSIWVMTKKKGNALLIENLKHNLLSVSQTCDQGHIVISDSQKCEIRREDSGKLVVVEPTTSSDVYILEIKQEEKCYIGQVDESWLWQRTMGHISFYNLVKMSNKGDIRNMPKIIVAPQNAQFFISQYCYSQSIFPHSYYISFTFSTIYR